MSDHDKIRNIEKVEAVIAIAGANFPRNTDVRIEVASPSGANASVTMHSYELAELMKIARSVLFPSPPSQEGAI